MQLSGMIRTTCPPARLVDLLSDPKVLAAMMPAGSDLRQTATGEFAFTIRKALGPLKFNMPGTLILTRLGDGHDRHMTAHASHLIGGKVDVTLDIKVTDRPAVTIVNYEGELTATGLANRLLGENSERAQTALRGFFVRLKRQAEGDDATPPQTKAAPKAARKG